MDNNIYSWFLIAALLWLALFVVPAYRLKRAILQVVGVFRTGNSFCSIGPKDVDEIGLTSNRGGLFALRDFTPYALQVLVERGIVHLSEDGKMCLQEKEASDFLRSLRLE